MEEHQSAAQDALLTEMVIKPSTWIFRRVEALSYLANGETQRRVSIDFQIPEGYAAAHDDQPSVLVPVGIIRKQPLTRFDMRSADGQALPVLETAANGRVAERILEHAVSAAFDLPATADERLRSLISAVVYAPSDGAERALSALRSFLLSDLTVQQEVAHRADPEPAQQYALQLAADLSQCFLLVVDCPRDLVQGRAILKYEYEDAIDLAPWRFRVSRPLQVRIDRPSVGDAGSYHLEIRAPEGVAARSLQIKDADASSDLVFLGRGPTVHGLVRGTRGDFEAAVRLVPERRGSVTWAFGVGLAVALGFVAMTFAWDPLHSWLATEPSKGSALATVLLAFPAFLLVLLARTPEHFVASRVLRPARWVLLLTSLLMIVAAAVLIVVPTLELGRGAMVVLALLQSGIAVAAVLIRRQSDPGPMLTSKADAGGAQ